MNDTNNQDFNAINPNMGSNNKSNTFNLVIGIATLIIALLGATFAYFSANVRSAENDVTVKSAYVSISYDGGTEIKATNLIPSSIQVAMNKYKKSVPEYNQEIDGDVSDDYDNYENDTNRKCVDAKGKEVCYVYQFSVTSDGAEDETTDILAAISINKNEFQNLSYMIYEVDLKKDENKNIVYDKYGFGIVNSYIVSPVYDLDNRFGIKDTSGRLKFDENPDNVDFQTIGFYKFDVPQEENGVDGITTINPVACLFGYNDDSTDIEDKEKSCKPATITNKEKHTYQLVIWLEETGNIQEEQGKLFAGTVQIDVVGGKDGSDYEDGKVTGKS